jgi:hypothetical protein
MITDQFGPKFLSRNIGLTNYQPFNIGPRIALPMTDTLSDPTQLSDKND